MKTRMEIKITETPVCPFDIVQIDTIGPMQKSVDGFQYAPTIVDELSKHLTSSESRVFLNIYLLNLIRGHTVTNCNLKCNSLHE